MSKDRQQRREQQASVTRAGDQITVTAQPTSTGKDIEAAVAKHEAVRDRELAQLREQAELEAERLDGSAPTVSNEVRQCERPGCENLGHQSVKQGVWLCEVHRGISEPATRTPAEIIEPADQLGGGIIEPEYERPVDRAVLIASLPPVAPLVSCPTCLGQGKIPKPEADRMRSAPPKPPANIPKAVHHLRRAANALPGDALRPAFEWSIRILVGAPLMPEQVHGRLVSETLADIASALEMDAHGGAQAARDVRAAIEALS